jgi:hypothetical protein
MELAEKIGSVLLRPREAWPEIREEQVTVKDLYESYAAILAAVPAIAHLIGMAVVGISFIGFRYRAPFASALGYAIVSYCLALIELYVFGLIVNGLAPAFGSTRNALNALKLSIYSATPACVAGLLFIFPFLMPIALLLSLYGFYLLYLGLPVLMHTPTKRRPLYFVVLVTISIVIAAAAGIPASLLFPQGRMSVI